MCGIYGANLMYSEDIIREKLAIINFSWTRLFWIYLYQRHDIGA